MSNEHPDREAALYRDLAKIEEFKREVRSLKTSLGKLKGRVESLELMGFQKQLDRLNDRITEFSSEFIQLQRFTHTINLVLFCELTKRIMHDQGHMAPDPETCELAEKDCSSKLKVYYAQALERIDHYKDSKDMNKVFKDFWKKANEILHDYGFPEVKEL
jgi:hypothetical protein